MLEFEAPFEKQMWWCWLAASPITFVFDLVAFDVSTAVVSFVTVWVIGAAWWALRSRAWSRG